MSCMLDQGTEQPHYFVCLLKIEAAGSRDFPQEGDGIETKDAHSAIQIESHDAHELQQHLRIAEIEIDLVVAEGAPDMARAAHGLHRAQ